MEEGVDGAGGGQRQAEARGGRCALGRDLHKGPQDRRGLGLRQRGLWQGLRAPRVGQGLGRPRAHQAHGVGEAGGGRSPIPGAVHWHRRAGVCAMAPGTRAGFVAPGRGGAASDGTHNAGRIASTHAVSRAHDPPGLGPGLGSLAAGVLEATPGRRGLALGLRQRAPLGRQTTRVLEGGAA